MATYKDIYGGNVRNFAGDPSNAINGQVWFDKTAVAFQYAALKETNNSFITEAGDVKNDVNVGAPVDHAVACTASALTTKSSASNLLYPIFKLF